MIFGAALLLTLATCGPTPIGKPELAAVLRDGHHAVFGVFPSRARLRSAWAQSALEVGQGARSRCHDVASIGAGPHEPFFVVAGAHFGARRDFLDGAIAYWTTVRRCEAALHAFDAELPEEAAFALRRCGYYRVSEALYAAGLRGLRGAARRAVAVL